MTNDMQTDITRFRHLLELFYEGATTPDEEQELMRCARMTDPARIPDDLRPDVEMLRSMAAADASFSGFAARIDDITAVAPAKPRRGFARRVIWGISAAAACAAIAFTVVRTVPDDDRSLTVSGSRPAIAMAATNPSSHTVPEEAAPEARRAEVKTVSATPDSPSSPVKSVAKQNPPVRRSETVSDPDTGNGISLAEKSADDLASQLKLVDYSLELLAENMQTTRESLTLTNDILNNVGNQLNRIIL